MKERRGRGEGKKEGEGRGKGKGVGRGREGEGVGPTGPASKNPLKYAMRRMAGEWLPQKVPMNPRVFY